MSKHRLIISKCVQAALFMLGLIGCADHEKERDVLRFQSFLVADHRITILTGVKHVYNLGIDRDGYLYLPQYVDGTILKLSPQLDLIATLCGPSGGWRLYPDQCPPNDQGRPEGDKSFQRPHSIVPDANGNLYIAEYKGGRVGQYNQSGELLRYLGSPSDPVTLQGPVVAWPEEDGYVYVGDAKRHIVVRYRSDGTFAGWLGADQDGEIALGFRFDKQATIASSREGGFHNPHLVRYGPDGDIYVVDTGNSRMQKFTKDGKFLGWLGGQEENVPSQGWQTGGRVVRGAWLGALAQPVSFDFDDHDNLYVLENENCRIQKFTLEGKAVSWFGRSRNGMIGWHSEAGVTSGNEAGAFKFPYDLRLLGGKLYVSDTHNARVQIISR